MEAHPLSGIFRPAGAATGTIGPAGWYEGLGRRAGSSGPVAYGDIGVTFGPCGRTGADVRCSQDENVLEAVVNEPVQQRIVVGVKRSAGSVAALRWAAAEARLRHTTLHVVHAWEPAAGRASYAILGDSHASGQERLRAREHLAAIMRALAVLLIAAAVAVPVTVVSIIALAATRTRSSGSRRCCTRSSPPSTSAGATSSRRCLSRRGSA